MVYILDIFSESGGRFLFFCGFERFCGSWAQGPGSTPAMSLSEDDPMQLYQKFTESFNKIAKPDENGEKQ